MLNFVLENTWLCFGVATWLFAVLVRNNKNLFYKGRFTNATD